MKWNLQIGYWERLTTFANLLAAAQGAAAGKRTRPDVAAYLMNLESVSEDRIPTTRTLLSSLLVKMVPSRVALKVGTHFAMGKPSHRADGTRSDCGRPPKKPAATE